MIFLPTTDDTLEIRLTGDGVIHSNVSWIDMTSSSATEGHTSDVLVSAGASTILAAPGASTRRAIKSVSLLNADTIPAEVRVQLNNGVSQIFLRDYTTLQPGDSINYEDGGRGWYVERAAGTGAYTGDASNFFKTGTGADTVGYHYCFAKDGGFPGAWSPGTPGLGGRTTDGTTSTDAGCIPIRNAVTGGNFITSFELAGTVAHFYTLFDVLWVNSGAVVTTTTGQTVNSGTLPARDVNGTTNGEGCVIGLLFTAASTNAAVINNSTVTYTNSAGTGSRTATLANLVGAQIPATPTIGTIVWFRLQDGDTGVRSIQTLTLGTSLATGSVSLLIARPLATYSSPIANVGAGPARPMDPGIRIFNGTCALIACQASATTATTISGSVVVQERAI